mgnify:CR=1 FL=1|tara:strand:- start:368 stop:628 length:261 start_codon:yes stop_codon:yes gene_type:complete
MGISRYEEEGYSTTIGVVDGVAWFEDGTSVNNVTVELIRAAPDLLDAATHALEDLQAVQTGQYTIDEISGVLIELRCAIAKAQGGK